MKTSVEVKDPFAGPLAAGVAACREAADMSHDALGQAMRALGFEGWTRPVVLAVEARRRRLSLAEIIGLAMIFQVPVRRLLGGTARVQVNSRLSLAVDTARKLLGGATPASVGLGRHDRDMGHRVWSDENLAELMDILADCGSRSDGDELAETIAGVLEIPAGVVAVLSLLTWGRLPVGERDHRAGREGTAPNRKWAGRQVVAELREVVGDLPVATPLQEIGRAEWRVWAYVPRWEDWGGDPSGLGFPVTYGSGAMFAALVEASSLFLDVRVVTEAPLPDAVLMPLLANGVAVAEGDVGTTKAILVDDRLLEARTIRAESHFEEWAVLDQPRKAQTWRRRFEKVVSEEIPEERGSDVWLAKCFTEQCPCRGRETGLKPGVWGARLGGVSHIVATFGEEIDEPVRDGAQVLVPFSSWRKGNSADGGGGRGSPS